MPIIATPEPIILTFGGGLNTRRRPHDIDINECTAGENFDLDPQQAAMTKRAAFDLVATAPNGQSIDGYAQLVKRDGTTTTLIQAGTTVYEWDHSSSFTSRGTVAAGTKLRGPREHNYTLDEFVIITDLSLTENVKKWDGTTFSDLAHNLTGTFKAKYCRVHQERAFYGNVVNGSSNLPHVIVGSKLEDAENLSVSTRPANVTVLTDPFFVTTLDLRPINALEQAFGTLVISTKRGRIFRLAGSNALDFEVQEFFPGAAVNGDEAVVNIGNDLALGLPARIEALSGVLQYGDVESDDLTLPIANLIETVTEWTLAYDRRRKLLYAFPEDRGMVFVLHKKFLDSQSPVSPWSKWTTGHTSNFQPTCVIPITDPVSGLDRMYFGDSLGRIFRFDGSGADDGGTTNINTSRTSGLIRGLPQGEVFEVEGWITYKKQFAATVTLTFLFAGYTVFDKSLTVTLPASDTVAVYNGSDYYDLSSYYGANFSERLVRQKFGPPGMESWFQVKVDVESEGAVEIHEIGLQFRSAADQ